MTTATAVPAGLGLMSCVREASPQDMLPQTDLDIERNESKKRKLNPFRGLRRIFTKKRNKEAPLPSTSDITPTACEISKEKEHSNTICEKQLFTTSPLSVSHDSVFTLDLPLETKDVTTTASIEHIMHQTVRAELLDALRRRRPSESEPQEEVDEGGAKSPSCSLNNPQKDTYYEDPKPQPAYMDYVEFSTPPLNHSAARHKLAIKPKKTHGPPRRRGQPPSTTGPALPTTPEVNEEVPARSMTPEASTARETIAELYSSSSTSMNVWNATNSTVSEMQLKSASLPPGLALPSGSNKLSRSRSNAGGRAKEAFAEEDEEEKTSREDKKKEESFFGRFLARRSGKKKKSKSEDHDLSSSTTSVLVKKTKSEDYDLTSSSSSVLVKKTKSEDYDLTASSSSMLAYSSNKSKSEDIDVSSSSSRVQIFSKNSTEKLEQDFKKIEEKRTYSVDSGISKVARSGPAARQRILPIDIPASPEANRHKRQQFVDLDLPMPPPQTSSSPEQITFLDPSPPKKKSILTKPIWQETSQSQTKNTSTYSEVKSSEYKPTEYKVSELKSEVKSNAKIEDCKTKVKISGLSSYQQRLMSYNDEFDSIGFKSFDDSLEDSNMNKLVTKSHSFRTKPVLSSTSDHSSLPFIVNSTTDNSSDGETFPDSLMTNNSYVDSLVTTNTFSSTTYSTSNTEHQVNVTVKETETSDSKKSEVNEKDSNNEVKIINTNLKKSESNERVASVDKNSTVRNESCMKEEKLENKNDGITISCLNSQVQSSVNTQSSNQVIVSISNPTEIVHNQEQTSSNKTQTETTQVSVTKVQLKRESKPVETTTKVPEFLKIQLNKVDVKPTNVVLTTNSGFEPDKKLDEKSVLEVETDRDSGEIVTESIKRKFSKDDVEIVDKQEQTVSARKESVSTAQTTIKLTTSDTNKQTPPITIPTPQPRKSSSISLSPTGKKTFLKKKSNSLELSETINLEDSIESNRSEQPIKIDSPKEKTDLRNTASTGDIQEAVLRRKSVSQKRDTDSDEPELMKVFARRSLKLKDSEAETLGQQVMIMVENSENLNTEMENKRDSDKENEGCESPPAEKPTFPFKEVSIQKEEESKFVETADVTLRKPISAINNKLTALGSKSPRAVTMQASFNSDENTDVDKRRNKSFIEAQVEKKSINNYRSHIMNIRDKDIDIKKSTEITKRTKTSDEIITNVSVKTDFENESFIPMFKRIQQRKEEWELRAQQNMKKSVP